MARRLDRWLVVVHVWRPIGSAVVPLADLTYWLRAELTGAALTGLDIEMIVRYGSPARELCAITAERKADDRDRRSRAVPAPVRRIGGRRAGQACPVPGGNRAVNSHHGTLKQESPLRPAGVQPCQRGMRSHLTGLLRREARLLRISQEDRWSFLFSQIAVYPFVVALVSGVFLVVSFRPSMTCVTYHGWYHELDGSFSLRRIRDGMAHRAGLFGAPSSIDASPAWPQREEIVAPAGYRDADVMRVTGTAAVPGSSS
jgi:hypothetical protein